MYESPIEIIHGQMNTQIENDVLQVVLDYGIHVDKEELIRALKYDRKQYEKGYNDAKLEEQRWTLVSEDLPKDREWYLGIFKESDTGWINPLPYMCDYVGRKTKATTKEGWILRHCTDRDEYVDYYFNLECVAWRQLPKSYLEGVGRLLYSQLSAKECETDDKS